MKNVDFVRNQQYILKNINWTVDKNEHWAILGLNGSGKSSLLKLIMAENWKTTGDLTVLAFWHRPHPRTPRQNRHRRLFHCGTVQA
jgi:ABC-type molybdenum transport system ATPase subunit/photorepair protein PhrA